MSFDLESDRKRIVDLEQTLAEVLDSELNATGGNDLSLINGTLGNRNSASGDEGGIRSNQPIIHSITDVDEDDVSTGVFDKINIISSMAIIDHTSTPITLRFIQGVVKDGTRIRITPKIGKEINIETGGNILATDTITITDADFYELVKYSEAETGVTGGAYKILLSSGNGGGTGFANTELSNLTTTAINTNLIPDTNSLHNLGESGKQWNTLWVDTLTNATSVVIASPNFAINSSQITLGDSTGDDIFFLGRVDSDIDPKTDSTRDLGASGLQWATLWVDTINSINTVVIASPNFAINSADITIGDQTSDDVAILGRINADIDPKTDSTYDLGASSLQWDTIWVYTLNSVNTIAITSPNFAVNSSQITLGDSTSDDVNILGRINSDVDPSADNTINFGSLTLTYGFSFFKGGHAIIEGYSTGFKPTGQTNTGIVFTVPTAGGKTELRCSFQTGVSQIIVTEP